MSVATGLPSLSPSSDSSTDDRPTYARAYTALWGYALFVYGSFDIASTLVSNTAMRMGKGTFYEGSPLVARAIDYPFMTNVPGWLADLVFTFTKGSPIGFIYDVPFHPYTPARILFILVGLKVAVLTALWVSSRFATYYGCYRIRLVPPLAAALIGTFILVNNTASLLF